MKENERISIMKNMNCSLHRTEVLKIFNFQFSIFNYSVYLPFEKNKLN